MTAPVRVTPPPMVRPARPEDARAIAEVHVESWRAAYAGILPAAVLDLLSVERRAEQWRATIERPGDRTVWVFERDGALVGFAATGPARDDDQPAGTGELEAIYLRSDQWGGGLGRALHDRAIADLEQRGFGPLVLWVLTDNRRGRAFYERQGWRHDGATRNLDFEGTSIEEVRYRRQDVRLRPRGADVHRTADGASRTPPTPSTSAGLPISSAYFVHLP